jgi:hypothetical protein
MDIPKRGFPIPSKIFEDTLESSAIVRTLVFNQLNKFLVFIMIRNSSF